MVRVIPSPSLALDRLLFRLAHSIVYAIARRYEGPMIGDEHPFSEARRCTSTKTYFIDVLARVRCTLRRCVDGWVNEVIGILSNEVLRLVSNIDRL